MLYKGTENLGDIRLWSQKHYRPPTRENIKKTATMHIVAKLLKTKGKGKVLKAAIG
jgi:hypothetical protein